MKPRLAMTQGDPAGVGPELCLRLLAEPALLEECTPVIFGDARVLRACAAHLGRAWTVPVLTWDQWWSGAPEYSSAVVVDCREIELENFRPGVVNRHTGQAAFRYVQRAIDAALAGRVEGVCTAPLHKEALHQAGIPFPGHTEIFASRTGAARSCMMQYSEELTCTFVTTHIGYAEVPRHLSRERVLEVIELTAEALERIRGRKPKLVVCGLNPHAGEHGLFGDREEERIIAPAVEMARERGFEVEGPVPPDTAFLVRRRRETDAVVCMYHDQGHIPIKALAFESAVNTTLGLPIVRTSVDHGTALDIAWQGKVDPSSLFAAVRLAVRLSDHTRSVLVPTSPSPHVGNVKGLDTTPLPTDHGSQTAR